MDNVSENSSGRDAVQQLISRYVGQLLKGCGDRTCDETLCASGRRNTSHRPTRGYTARSARTVALTLVSGPKPRSRLCSRYQPKHDDDGSVKPEPPRDPSSFTQQLSDTAAVRSTLGSRDGSAEGTSDQLAARQPFFDDDSLSHLWTWRKKLSEFERLKSLGHVEDCLVGDLDLSQILRNGMRFFAIYEPDKNRGQRIGDRFYFGPAQQLLDRTLLILGTCIRSSAATTDFLRELMAPMDTMTKSVFVLWLKETFMRTWNGELLWSKDSVAYVALLLLTVMHDAQMHNHDMKAADKLHKMPSLVAQLDPIKVAQTISALCDPRMEKVSNDMAVLPKFENPFTAADKALWLRTYHHMRMSKTQGMANVNRDLRTYGNAYEVTLDPRLQHQEQHYLLLSVSRATALEDAFMQLWQRRKTELLLPLRVRMSEADDDAIGQDLGGVQIEFFNLVYRELFKEEPQMFTALESGYSYFRAGSLQPLYHFELCGVLFALAFYNGIPLPVSLPLVFYRLFQDNNVAGTYWIRDGWPTVARSLDNIIDEGGQGLELVFPLEANGLRLSISEAKHATDDDRDAELHIVEATRIQAATHREGPAEPVDLKSISDAWPGWKLIEATQQPKEITEENSVQYANSYTAMLTHGFVSPQLKAFHAGFFSVIDPNLMKFITPRHFQEIMEGSMHIDIDELRRTTEYGEPYRASSSYIQSFWRIVSAWSQEKQMQLIKFVTAAERIPAAGVGNLAFQIHGQSHGNPNDLPSSSTCFGTLYLPRYSSTKMLSKKLDDALNLGLEGFGQG
ncbi:uncharacterized protein LTR77_011136 [Saxophila tyrrhenica]|uniref:HECT-type E3 ubiquitin transferase n=1 Tax=Saxophila tyrrhenica TaxID=1690608 RepID=A0AAV9NTW3_9PEZI|nr:hypothetical protein LTR77_011136 [Saxophila tyrrhenica]